MTFVTDFFKSTTNNNKPTVNIKSYLLVSCVVLVKLSFRYKVLFHPLGPVGQFLCFFLFLSFFVLFSHNTKKYWAILFSDTRNGAKSFIFEERVPLTLEMLMFRFVRSFNMTVQCAPH